MQESPYSQLLGAEHEEVHFFTDPVSGLEAIVALHDLSRGPALGGTRWREYGSAEEALRDVLALSEAMTRKAALAELPAGGGKAVILARPGLDRAAVFAAFGERVESLGGRFFTSSDLGTQEADLEVMAGRTRYVTWDTRDRTGDLAAATAEGVFLGASACLEALGIDQWRGATIAIQGLGKIGLLLARRAARAGAQIFASEPDSARVEHAVEDLPVTLVPVDEIAAVPCDVFSPCAVGGILDERTIEALRCKVVAGAANNPLVESEGAAQLHSRGILYAPDFVVNAGALIQGCAPALAGRPAPDLTVIERTMRSIALESLSTGRSPSTLALERADRIWRAAREARASRSRAASASEESAGDPRSS